MEKRSGHYDAGACFRLEGVVGGAGGVGARGENDNSSFAASLVASRRELYRWARFLTQDHDEADDLVQAAFESSWTARDGFRSGTNLLAWLKSIVRNRFIDDRRHAAVCRRRLETNEPQAQEPLGPLDILGLDDIVVALARLRTADRELIEIACLKRTPHMKISAQLGTKVSTTGTRLFRAKEKLRQALQKIYEERLALLRPPVRRAVPPRGSSSPADLRPR